MPAPTIREDLLPDVYRSMVKVECDRRVTQCNDDGHSLHCRPVPALPQAWLTQFDLATDRAFPDRADEL